MLSSDEYQLLEEIAVCPCHCIGRVAAGVRPESKSYNDEGMTEIPSRWKGECQNGTDLTPSMCNKKLVGARYFNKGWKASHPGSVILMDSGEGELTFEANWSQLDGFEISVVPNKLVFKEKNEIKSYKVRLESTGQLEADEVVYGPVIWKDSNSKYAVQSPMVATTINISEFS